MRSDPPSRFSDSEEIDRARKADPGRLTGLKSTETCWGGYSFRYSFGSHYDTEAKNPCKDWRALQDSNLRPPGS